MTIDAFSLVMYPLITTTVISKHCGVLLGLDITIGLGVVIKIPKVLIQTVQWNTSILISQ